MTVSEANNIIAKFTGITRGYEENGHYHEDYSESLEVLVPVIMNLKACCFKINIDVPSKAVSVEVKGGGPYGCDCERLYFKESLSPLSETVAVACATVIKLLNSE